MADTHSSPAAGKPVKFGVFGGVFTPSLLTILGVIMFLRFPAVVGYAGLWRALLILAAAKAISVITSLSIATIATNMRVQGGGPYFLISRSLGVEFGGVIAVFFFVAQAAAVSLYVLGFTEALFAAWPGAPIPFRDVATFTHLAVLLCVYIGAGWTIRMQYGILAVLLLSVLSFVAGAARDLSLELLRANLTAGWTPLQTPVSIFALFFPAVTGIMAGVNMSGDLRDPSRALPRGLLAAVTVSGLLYALLCLMLAASVPRVELVGSGFVLKDRALVPFLLYAGVFSATLSSALGSMMGAPRVLQAFARDEVVRPLRFFGRGSGASNEPRRAMLLTALIAQLGILAGNLDAIAPVITMFFLMTYGTVNLACFYESRSHNPSFRPTFRGHHWLLALAGAAGCFAVMFLIHPVWAALAIGLAGLLYTAIARAEIRWKWGDVDSGLAFQKARDALLRLEQERFHPKNWRPAILALSGGAHNRLHLAAYACWLTAENGIVSIGQVIRGNLADLMDRRQEAESILRKFLRRENLLAFPVVIVEETIHTAIQAILQCHGIGGLRPNTVLVGWSEDPSQTGIFSSILKTSKRMNRNIVIAACGRALERATPRDGAITVWWNSDANGPLMLLLAFLLKKHPIWHNCPLRILRPIPDKADVHNVAQQMQTLLTESRIEADLTVVPTDDALESVRTLMEPSAVLFAGFDPDDMEPESRLTSTTRKIAALPGDVLLVYSAGNVSLQA